MKNKIKSLYLSVSVFNTAARDTVNRETNITNQQKLGENPNWKEADQLVIYKACKSPIRDYRGQIHPVAGRRT